MSRAAFGQHKTQHFLDAGLADRPRHGHNFRARAGARGDAKALHGAQGIVDRKDRPLRGKPALPVARDDAGARPCGESARDMVMAVTRIALDRKEQIARRKQARIDRHAFDRRDEGRAGRTQNLRQFRLAP